jgi:hypothetical protein
VLTLQDVEGVSNGSAVCPLAQIRITLHRESFRVHRHVQAPDDLAREESQQVEEGIDKYAWTVPELREGLRRGGESQNISGAGESAMTNSTHSH